MNSDGRKILLHVGVAKSGTTSLQENLFAKLDDCACVGRPNHLNAAYRGFHRAMTTAEDGEVAGLVAGFAEQVRTAPRRTVILSDETLVAQVNSIPARRLAECFPDAHILITVRNQITSIPSFYTSHGRHAKGTAYAHKVTYVTFEEFTAFFRRGPETDFALSLKYHRLAETYRRYFSNVTVLAFEEMIKDDVAFMTKLGAVLGRDPQTLLSIWRAGETMNAGDSGRLHGYLRLRQRIPVSSLRKLVPIPAAWAAAIERFLRRGRTHKVELTEVDKAFVRSVYGPENARLQNDFNVSLEGWGYPVDDAAGPGFQADYGAAPVVPAYGGPASDVGRVGGE